MLDTSINRPLAAFVIVAAPLAVEPAACPEQQSAGLWPTAAVSRLTWCTIIARRSNDRSSTGIRVDAHPGMQWEKQSRITGRVYALLHIRACGISLQLLDLGRLTYAPLPLIADSWEEKYSSALGLAHHGERGGSRWVRQTIAAVFLHASPVIPELHD